MQEKKNSFEKNSIVLFSLMMAANICSYLFQITTGKLLSIEDFGKVNTLLSLLTIFTIPNTIIALISARYIAQEKTSSNIDGMVGIVKILFRFVFLVTIILVVIGSLGAPYLDRMFKINNPIYIIYILILAVISMIYYVVYGIQQGLQEFVRYGIQTVLLALGKLVFSIIFIVAGFQLYGVFTGILIGTVCGILYGIIPIWKLIKKSFIYKGETGLDLKEFSRFTAGTIAAQGSIIAITNGDMLLVKYYFSETEAGIYSSAMVIGKIAMYISAAIIATLFPLVVDKYARGENTKPVLKKAFFYGGGMCIVCAAGMILLGKYVIGILFGERYLLAIKYLPAVCIFVVPLTFVTILMNYLLAVNRIKIFAVSSVCGIVACVLLTGLFHTTIPNMMMIVGGVLALIFGLNMLFLQKKIK